MAIYTANQSGNLSTAATWDTVTNTPTISNSSDQSVTTSDASCDDFTAPNTTNAVTGVWIYMASPPASGRNWVATLYESGVSTGKSATIQQTDMPVNAGWIYFRLATSYVFTTTSANAYVWKLKSTTANSGTVARNGAASRIACLSTDDRTGSPTTTDSCWIGAHNCTGSAITVTVDGTGGDIRGSGTNQAVTRSITQGLQIGGSLTDSLAILKFDTSASASLSVTAMCIITDGGELQMGTVASPYPAAYTATYTARQGSGGTNTGILRMGTGKVILQGASRTYYATNYVSGTGVAASPLVVSDAVDWNVGDRIAVTATSANGTNYNETEYRFIITKNSSTSYVLSSTSGGAETAFSFTHNTNAKVLLLTRNVIITNSVASQLYINLAAISTAASGYVDIDWAYIKSPGSYGGTPTITASGSSLYGLLINASSYVGIDYTVFDTVLSYGIINYARNAQTYTGNIFCASQNAGNANSTLAGLVVGSTGSGHTFIDHYFIGNQRNGVYYNGVNCTFTNLHCSGNNMAGTADNGGIVLAGGAPCIATTANIHANRIAGIVCGGTTNSIFTSCEVGTKGANQTSDIYVTTETANKILFNSSNFSSTSLVSNYLNGADGATLITFDTLNGTTNNHKWYTEYGSAQSTGSGLSDTTVRTSGTLNVRINAEDSSPGFKYEYRILAVPSKAVFALGFIQRNAAFATDTCLVELFLPGSTVADASQTMATTTGTYLPFSIAATYNGAISRYATVRISARTTTSAAYIYVADLFNGTNNITNFNTWFEGQPSEIMFEQLGDAAAVWAVPISTMTTSGTIGYYIVKKLLSVAKFLSLK